MTIGGERASVRNPLIEYSTEINWTYINPDDALTLRGGETGIVFRETFISQIQKLNPFMSPGLAGELMKRMEIIPPTIEGNLLAWEYLKGLKQVFIPDEKRERDVIIGSWTQRTLAITPSTPPMNSASPTAERPYGGCCLPHQWHSCLYSRDKVSL
jgi:hypothetical protein